MSLLTLDTPCFICVPTIHKYCESIINGASLRLLINRMRAISRFTNNDYRFNSNI